MGQASWRILDLDDVRILFQYPAGKTHFLNQSSAFILDLLADAPLAFPGISDALSEELGAELTTSQITQLANHVERLKALGLIARLSRLANEDRRASRRTSAPVLASGGVKIELGPFTVQVRADYFPALSDQIRSLHADYPTASPNLISHFHVRLARAPGPRRWVRPQVRFYERPNHAFPARFRPIWPYQPWSGGSTGASPRGRTNF